MAISRLRTLARASRRLATLAQAISSTQITAAQSSSTSGRALSTVYAENA